MGTGPACYLASKYECGGLILCSPYTSVREAAKFVIKNNVTWCCVCAAFGVPNIFRNKKLIQNIHCPLLLIHGDHDKVTPYKGSKLLYNLAKCQTLLYIVDCKGHNDLGYISSLFQPL